MSPLSERESVLLDLLRTNPFASQSELAAELGVARSTVALMVTDLMDRGLILGRGYIMAEAHHVACLGGAAIDRKYRTKSKLIGATSNPSESYFAFGGVARNVAETLARLGHQTKLLSLVGDDDAGRSILDHMAGLDVDVSQTVVGAESSTAEYVAVLDDANDLYIGLAAMDAFDAMTPDFLAKVWPHIASSQWVFVDCNVPEATLHALLERKKTAAFKVAVDTVSVPKAARLPDDLSAIDVLFTNVDEACALLSQQGLQPQALVESLTARGVKQLVLTMGAQGHLLWDGEALFNSSSIAVDVVDVTGAGDALISGTLSGLVQGLPLGDASRRGALLAALTLETETGIVPHLTADFLAAQADRLGAVTMQRLSLP